MRWIDYLFGIPVVFLLSLFRYGGGSDAPKKKILIIKLAAAGDTILLIPILREIRKKFPLAQIDWLVSPINAQIATNVSYVNNTIVWNQRSFWDLFRLIRLLRSGSYDVVLDFEQWARGTAILSYMCGAPERFGFDTPGQYRHGLYTKTVRKTYGQHELLEFKRLAELLTPDILSLDLEFLVKENPPDAVCRLPGRKIVIHPGCGVDGTPREWPLAKYAVLIQWLMKHWNASIILTGGPDEMKKTSDLNKLIGGVAINYAGKLNWGQTAAVLTMADLVLSGNTGIMHLAAALKRPQIALHGPTSDVLWGPINQHAHTIRSSCRQCPCLRLGFEYHSTNHSCMDKIEIEDVKKVINSVFDNPPGI